VPTSFQFRWGVAAGGLMSYEANAFEMFCLAGAHTGRILKGDKPGDLPVLQSTKFEFVINLKTARALEIEVPPGLLSIDENLEDLR
jgi:putative tryptophan/tyrosine transport system substrate-binding protein